MLKKTGEIRGIAYTICRWGAKCDEVPAHRHDCYYCQREDGTLTTLPLYVHGPDGKDHALAVHSICGQILVMTNVGEQ